MIGFVRHICCSWFTVAIAGSILIHAGMLGIAVGWGWWPSERAQLPGEGTKWVMASSAGSRGSRAQTEPWHAPVVVMPREVRIEHQRFVQKSSDAVELERLPLELSPEGEFSAQAAPRVSLPEQSVAKFDEPPPPNAVPGPTRSWGRPARLGAAHAQTSQSPGSGGRAPARFVSNRPPIYPAEAIRQGLEGEVLLAAEVTPTGEIKQISIARSSGHPILDAAAINAVRTWRFQPAHDNYQPVGSVEVLPVRFRFPGK